MVRPGLATTAAPALSPFVVGHADYDGVRNIVVREQPLFDFGGRYVLAAPDDDVVRPPADEQVTRLIQVSLIARVEEPILIEDRADAGELS
jgi:hypothetical protein